MLTIQSFLLKFSKIQLSKSMKKNVKYALLMFTYVFAAIFVVLKFNVFQLNKDQKSLEAFAAQNITEQKEETSVLDEVDLLGQALEHTSSLKQNGINNIMPDLVLSRKGPSYTALDSLSELSSHVTIMSADFYAGDLVNNIVKTTISNDTVGSKTENASASKSKTKSNNVESATKETVSQNAKETMNSDVAVLSLSTKEIEILERIVEAEATGEDIKGKILVANVIINRVNDSSFPDTVEEVVFQKTGGTYQFSPISDKRYYSVKISDETKEAVRRVLHGEDYSQGALYFSARKRASAANMKWFDSKLKRLFQYGGHEFFTHK